MAIHFTIERSGRIFNSRADGGAPFFIGCQTSYHDKSSDRDFEGLFKSGDATIGAGWPLMTNDLKKAG